jgi:hypothetical protein
MNILEYFGNTNIRNKYIVCVAEENKIDETNFGFEMTYYVCHNAAWLMDFLSSDFIASIGRCAVAVYGIDFDGNMFRYINCRRKDHEFKDFLNVEVFSLENINYEPVLLNENNLK